MHRVEPRGHGAPAAHPRALFVAGRYTIADIALYAYTHIAPQGEFSLETYPAIREWLERVASQAGHIPISA